MKIKNYYIVGATLLLSLSACNSYLDREPQSTVSPSNYLTSAKHLDAYASNQYTSLITSNSYSYQSMLNADKDTDDKITSEGSAWYAPGEVRVAEQGGVWNFKKIRECNYFFAQVLPKLEAGEIAGSRATIDHYIGEMHFFRAYEYFKKLQACGDFPIITETLGMNSEKLMEASQRDPRSEVARFILEDLDKAINLLMEKSIDGNKNRLSKDVARLFKSRVALYEASWLHNFAGTAFVPNGPNWPGAEAHSGYQFQAGSLEGEVNWLLDEAMAAAKVVGDNHMLTDNAGYLQQSAETAPNPYFNMFGDFGLSGYDEVLLWRDYDAAQEVYHGNGCAAATGNYFVGASKGLIESYLMANGLPIYATGSGYQGDDTTSDVVIDRDGRLQLFLKIPGQYNKLWNESADPPSPSVEGYPMLFHTAFKYVTGYCIRKFGSFDGLHAKTGKSFYDTPVFRSAEAMLNYMEACYMRTGSLDGTSDGYWKAIRTRAQVDTDYQKTIDNTDMTREAEGDWGAYSAGVLVDATLYNIRRERRNELMSEGFRDMDLKRWRALDQLAASPHIMKGFKLWGPMQEWYKNDDGTSQLITEGNKANVSPESDGEYLCPHRINNKHINYNGFSWTMAHYLSPIAAKHFTLTGGEQSTIYQNPGWGKQAGESAKSI